MHRNDDEEEEEEEEDEISRRPAQASVLYQDLLMSDAEDDASEEEGDNPFSCESVCAHVYTRVFVGYFDCICNIDSICSPLKLSNCQRVAVTVMLSWGIRRAPGLD